MRHFVPQFVVRLVVIFSHCEPPSLCFCTSEIEAVVTDTRGSLEWIHNRGKSRLGLVTDISWRLADGVW